MAVDRYSVPDSYTMEELHRRYQRADVEGRITLLKELYSIPPWHLPYEIAVMAVEDENSEVREWVARNGKFLGYSREINTENMVNFVDDSTKPDSQGEPVQKNTSDPDLERRLLNDPDPFVRACLRENPRVFFGGFLTSASDWEGFFTEAEHMERLALMRNPNVTAELVEKIFDHEDNTFGIDSQERKELALAFLTNSKAIRKVRDRVHLDFEQEDFCRIWRLASQWPDDKAVKAAVYLHLPADDKTKAEAYKKCISETLRSYILRNCNGLRDKETLALGLRDEDETCRDLAKDEIENPGDNSTIIPLMKRDKKELRQLARNRRLTFTTLRQIRRALENLGDDVGVAYVNNTIRRVRKKEGDDHLNPDELFSPYEDDYVFLDDKIDFIGKKVLKIDESIGRTKRQLVAVSEEFMKAMGYFIIAGLVVYGMISIISWLISSLF